MSNRAHENPADCNGGHGCGGQECTCPCHMGTRWMVYNSEGDYLATIGSKRRAEAMAEACGGSVQECEE